ncbi:hypothetical protein BGZ95_009396 [Linnemannia exigua]|uniref:Uncharacterized protein n=1 Tax=Linnemannia exigua TaxID=604196 RepID=A0AAD4H6S5_9FUNG|nr:hypothetical protein BGZ95_009396 [Linnemannia exigua]
MGLAGTESPQQNLTAAYFKKWSSAHYSTTPSDKIISRDAALHRKAWPAIHCIKKSDQFISSNMPERTKEPSDNVPLFLSQREPGGGEGLEKFEPTILMKRFKKWQEVQDELHLPNGLNTDLETLDADEDLRLLEEEGEFMFRHNLDLEDYKGLCEKHRLQHVLQTITDQDTVENIMDQFVCIDHDGVPSTPGSSENQGTMIEDADAGDLLLAGQDPVMELPRIVGWAAFNSDVMQNKSRESVRGMVDPDFVLEQDPTSPTDKLVRGTLKQMWPRLDSVQHRHLLRLLVRMLIVVWDNFDMLDDEQYDTSLASQGQDVSQIDQEEIHCQTRPEGAGPWAKQDDADYNTTATVSGQQSAEDRLRQVEDEFMNRSFLDAVREASKAVQSQPVEHRDHKSVDCFTLPLGNAFTVRGVAGKDTNAGATSTPRGAHLPWNLDDYDNGQRMTTTRARAKESLIAQGRTFILPLHPSDARECGSARPFDFSLDDLLVQASARQESWSLSVLRDPKIIGVSRWKSMGPRPPSTSLLPHPKELLPSSSNVFQTAAQGSPYPLVHLFSLPDVFCPVQFGGQEEGGEERIREGLSHVFVRTLTKHRPLAAEFLTEEVEDKERRMYHRWMAAWHEHSPRAPKATKTRYEMMKLLRQHYQEGRRLFSGMNTRGDDMTESTITVKEEEPVNFWTRWLLKEATVKEDEGEMKGGTGIMAKSGLRLMHNRPNVAKLGWKHWV